MIYFTATEVVLLLKLGRNEVFFDINQRKDLWVLHNLPYGVIVKKRVNNYFKELVCVNF
jgi:hypothetical protein